MEKLLLDFFSDDRVRGLLLLIIAQTFLRMGYAFKTWTFDLTQVANFYRSKVIPYIFGSLGLYIASRFMPASNPLGEYSSVVSEATFSLVWFLLIANIAGDIVVIIDAFGNGKLLSILERVPVIKALGLSKVRP